MREDITSKLYFLREKLVSLLTRAEKLLNKTVLIGGVVVLLIWFNFDRIVELLVNEEKIKKNIIQKLDEATGKRSDITGELIFRSDPEPVAIINNVRILNDSKITNEDFFSAQKVTITPDVISAVMGKPKFKAVFFENVTINIDSNGSSQTEDEVHKNLKKIFSSDSQFNDKKVRFADLKVNFIKKNPLNENKPIVRKFIFPELELTPNMEEETSNAKYIVKGSINSKKFREIYYFNFNLKDGFGKKSAYDGKLYSTGSEILFSGDIDTQEKMAFTSKIDGKFNGLAKKVFSLAGIPEDMLESMKDNDESKLSGEINFDGKSLDVKELKSDGKVVSFIINSKTSFADNTVSNINVNINKFDYSNLFKSQQEILSSKKAKRIEDDFKKKLEEYFLFAVGDDVNFEFAVAIPEINFYHDRKGSFNLKAHLKNNQFRLESLKASLPGETQFNMVGVVEINKEQKQLKGASRIIFAGKKMDDLFLALDGTTQESKDTRFGPFYIDAKGFLYGQNIHFREIVARINDDKFAGQMLIDYSQQFNASAAFNFTNLNIDKYIESNDKRDLGLFRDDNPLAAKFDFLRVIDSIFDKLDVSIVTDKLTKADYDYRDVSVFAQIMPGVTEIRDIYFDSDLLGQVKGKAHIDLTDFQPKIDIDLKMDRYDMDLLVYGEIVKQDDKYNFDGKWSTEKVTFERLGAFKGKINLNIKEFKFYHFFMKNFVMDANALEGRLNINELRTELFGNKIDFKGYITTEYPSFNITFMSTDLDSDLFMADTLGIEQISSNFNMSGVLASYGFSIEQMIQNLKGNFSIATKGFVVTGFDFDAVIKALAVAKRLEYIKVISAELLNKGATDFGFFTGTFTIDSGQINFSDLKIFGPTIRSATASGTIDLIRWQLAASGLFSLNTGDRVNLILKSETTGPINKFKTKWDDKGMTEYWENKFYGVQ